MDKTELAQLFQLFKKYNALPVKAEEAIAAISSIITVKKNKDLQPIGHTCKTIYFINKGIARIYYFKDGIDITENFFFENNIIARVESLFTGKPSRKAIQILEDAEIVGINANQLFKLYDSFPEIERLFRKIFEAAYVEKVHRIEGIQFHTAEERYKALLQEAPDILKRVPLKYVASYLGITQVSLSRIRGLK
ncbi:MAG TPA: Crp/Fnr family transcriptional regulator [Chitinophagaceae bacterium]|nr:Crp/Fnr family transcriptional regulator [Chitinophagaceae bacterium]HQV86529.1 Crp/Fnr family transcriptional regulator [Chitinophagaceae bacterium]HQX74523.1 Crp/Fnr family transcriptional regulator [Chitinophagaceae bacterium]HQZ74863.1 Crp/Fnr family transcriptional regulator [Chitinophagaceae bacterium]